MGSRAAAAGIVSTVALLSVVGDVAATLYSDLQRLVPDELRLRDLAAQIGMLDELSTSATLAAANDGSWSSIVRHDDAEADIDAALAEVRALEPGIAALPSFIDSVAADRALDRIELDAFVLVRLHDLAGARVILADEAYVDAERRAADALARLNADIAARADERFRAQRVHVEVAVVAASLAFVLLLFVWIRLGLLLRDHVRSVEDRARLAWEIAHELNTPAGVVTANLEFIRGKVANDDDLDEAAAEAQSASARMSALVNELRYLKSRGL